MTSGEYAYDLLKRLQRNFRCTDSGQRMFLYNFFGGIFNDPSVTITHDAYTAFCDQMDADASFYAQQGLTSLDAIYRSEHFNDSWAMMKKSFEKINISVEYGNDSSKGWIEFTLPSGEVKTINSNQGLGNSYLCSRTGVVFEYAKEMMPFYDLYYDKQMDLADTNTNIAGYGVCWEYDGDGEVMITGDGTLASSSLFTALGIISQIKTFIVGSGITRFLAGSLHFNIPSIDIVFLHGKYDKVTFDHHFSGVSENAEVQYHYNVYTDCEAIKQASFQPNISVNFYPLSEWKG